jgi:hypothetical protein
MTTSAPMSAAILSRVTLMSATNTRRQPMSINKNCLIILVLQSFYVHCKEACKTHTSIRLASHLVRTANSSCRGHEFESPAWIELVALAEGGKTLGVRPSYSGDPEVIMSCLTCSTQSGCVMCNSRSLASHWQTHLPGRLTSLALHHGVRYISTKPSPREYRRGTGEITVKNTAETQTSIRLASF